jgi:hypothetical protein
MSITGRPAQFGRGVISDVADKIIGQFSSCLADKLADKQEAPAPAATSSANGAAAPATAGSSTAPAAGAPAAVTTPRPASSPTRSSVDAIDLLDSAGAPVLKRLAPVAGGLALLLAILMIIRRVRSS